MSVLLVAVHTRALTLSRMKPTISSICMAFVPAALESAARLVAHGSSRGCASRPHGQPKGRGAERS